MKLNNTFLNNQEFTEKIKREIKNYIETKYNNAGSIIDLMRIRPDWSEQALLNKYEALHGNRNLILGKIPKQIPKAKLRCQVTGRRSNKKSIKHKKPYANIGKQYSSTQEPSTPRT